MIDSQNNSVLQGQYIESKGWVERRYLSLAYRLALHQGVDICSVLVNSNSITEAQADEARRAVVQHNQGLSAPQSASSLPQAVLSDAVYDSRQGPETGRHSALKSQDEVAAEGLQNQLHDDSDSIETLKLNIGAGEVNRLRQLSTTLPSAGTEETVADSASLENEQITPPANQFEANFFRAGDRFGKFVIEEELARGGMGVVFRATANDKDSATQQRVALKVILANQEDDLIERFKREIAVLKSLDHPGIVQVFESGQEGPLFYYAMELFSHSRLTTVAQRSLEKGDVHKVLRYLRDIAHALAYCHEKGVIHRDVKPQNIVIDPESDKAVLIDFGVMKKVKLTDTSVKDQGQSTLTKSGQFVGSPAYMSPEQYGLKSFGELNARSDVWAFGVTMFRVLAGEMPFKDNDIASLLDAFIAKKIPELHESDSRFKGPISQLVRDCMRCDQTQRPSMSQVIQRLDKILEPQQANLTLVFGLLGVLVLTVVTALIILLLK